MCGDNHYHQAIPSHSYCVSFVRAVQGLLLEHITISRTFVLAVLNSCQVSTLSKNRLNKSTVSFFVKQSSQKSKVTKSTGPCIHHSKLVVHGFVDTIKGYSESLTRHFFKRIEINY